MDDDLLGVTSDADRIFLWDLYSPPYSLVPLHPVAVIEGELMVTPFLTFFLTFVGHNPNSLALMSFDGDIFLTPVAALVQREFYGYGVLVPARQLTLPVREQADELLLVQQADFGKLSSKSSPPVAFCSQCGRFVRYDSATVIRRDEYVKQFRLIRKYGLCRACYLQLQRSFKKEIQTIMSIRRQHRALQDKRRKQVQRQALRARHVPQQFYDATDVLLLYQEQKGKCQHCGKYLLDVLWDGVLMQYRDSTDKAAGMQLMCGSCANIP